MYDMTKEFILACQLEKNRLMFYPCLPGEVFLPIVLGFLLLCVQQEGRQCFLWFVHDVKVVCVPVVVPVG